MDGLTGLVDQFLIGLGETLLTIAFVGLALAMIYIGATRLLGVRPIRSAVDIAL